MLGLYLRVLDAAEVYLYNFTCFIQTLNSTQIMQTSPSLSLFHSLSFSLSLSLSLSLFSSSSVSNDVTSSFKHLMIVTDHLSITHHSPLRYNAVQYPFKYCPLKYLLGVSLMLNTYINASSLLERRAVVTHICAVLLE